MYFELFKVVLLLFLQKVLLQIPLKNYIIIVVNCTALVKFVFWCFSAPDTAGTLNKKLSSSYSLNE